MNPFIIEMGGLELILENDNKQRLTEFEHNAAIARTDDSNNQSTHMHERIVLGWGEDSSEMKGIWKQILTPTPTA